MGVYYVFCFEVSVNDVVIVQVVKGLEDLVNNGCSVDLCGSVTFKQLADVCAIWNVSTHLKKELTLLSHTCTSSPGSSQTP